MIGPLRTACLLPMTLLALSACDSSDDSPVDASPAAQASSAACTKAAGAWPKDVSGLSTYSVTTSSKTVRAWGEDADHAVIARCGVTSPGPTSNACFSADDIDWVDIPLSDGHRYVTYGRSPAIEVLVPSNTKLDGTVLAAFTPAARTIPQGSHRCS